MSSHEKASIVFVKYNTSPIDAFSIKARVF